MGKKIFISYYQDDHKPNDSRLRALRDILKTLGFEDVLDQTNLHPDQEILIALQNLISESDYFILLLSKTWRNSKWMLDELDWARQCRKKVIQIQLEDCELLPINKEFLILRINFNVPGLASWLGVSKLAASLNKKMPFWKRARIVMKIFFQRIARKHIVAIGLSILFVVLAVFIIRLNLPRADFSIAVVANQNDSDLAKLIGDQILSDKHFNNPDHIVEISVVEYDRYAIQDHDIRTGKFSGNDLVLLVRSHDAPEPGMKRVFLEYQYLRAEDDHYKKSGEKSFLISSSAGLKGAQGDAYEVIYEILLWQAAQKTNEISKAVNFANRLLELDTTDATYTHFMGICKLRQGEVGKALSYFNQSLKKEASLPMLLSLDFLVRSKCDTSVIATSPYKSVLKLSQAYYLKCETKETKCLIDTALIRFEGAYQRNSRDFEVVRNLALFKGFILKDLNGAEKLYQEAYELNISNRQLHQNLGVLYSLNGDWANAKRSLRRALDIDPFNWIATMELAKCFLRNPNGSRMDLDSAEVLLRRAIKLKPQRDEAYHQLGNLHLLAGNCEMAMDYYHIALEIEDNIAEYHFDVARVEKMCGSCKRATLFWRKAIELEPLLRERDTFEIFGKPIEENCQ